MTESNKTRSKALIEALKQPNGARFYRCALQVNPFAYHGRHAKQSQFQNEADYNAAIVEAWMIHRPGRWLKRCRRESLVRELQAFRAHGGIAYTTDYILDETITLLFKRLPVTIAKESLTHLETAVVEGYLAREWISPDRFENAVSLRLKLHDKPEISFTDLTSMTVMRDLKIDTILTDDDHFIKVGLGFTKAPG